MHPAKTIAVSLFAFSIARPLAVRADDQVPPEALDHVHWKFSNFLEGDTIKIRDLIDGPLEQQLSRKAKKTKLIASDKAAIDAKEQTAAVELRKSSADFMKLESDLAAAKTDFTAAKKASDAVAMINAQNEVEQLEAQVAAQEDRLLANDPDVAAKRKEIKETQKELRDLEPAIDKASKARDQWMDGMRMSQRLLGPPEVGHKGVLGRIKPTRIVDGQSFIANYDAVEITGDNKNGKAPDGMKALTGVSHPIHILVKGVNTEKLRVGRETILDHFFAITGTQKMGSLTVYVVEPDSSEIKEQAYNHLFDRLEEMPASDD